MDDRPTALITGATSGIGLALVQRMSDDQRLILTGRRDPSVLPEKLPQGAQYIKADLSVPGVGVDTIEAAFKAADHKSLDRLIVNAGTGFYAPVEREDAGMIRSTLDVNLGASVILACRFAPYLEAVGGTVVFIGSVAHRGAANMPSYAASKAGLAGLARSLGSEWEGRIGVQIIHPGPTRTGMHEKAGYPTGGKRDRLFFSSEGMADEIIRLMDSGRPHGTVMLRAGLRQRFSGKRS